MRPGIDGLVWSLPESAWALSLEEMALDGHQGNEGVALWLGRRQGLQADVTHVVALRGKGVIKEPAHLSLQASLLNDVTDLAIAEGVLLLGQVHSHGPYHGVDLSEVDRRYGFAVPGYLSLVAPDYARRADTRVTDCGVHVFKPGEGFVRLGIHEVERRVRVVRDGDAILRHLGATGGLHG